MQKKIRSIFIILLISFSTLCSAQFSSKTYSSGIDTLKYQLQIDSLTNLLLVAQGTKEADIKLNLGKIYFDKSEYSIALEYYKDILEFAKKKKAISVQAVINREIGKIYYHLGDYTTALEYEFMALEQLEKGNQEQEYSQVFNMIGLILLAKQDNNQALKYFEKACELNKKYEEKFQLAINSSNIADIYYLMGDFERALNMYIQSYEIIKNDTTNTPRNKAIILMQIGKVYHKIENFPQAEIYFFKALDKIDKMGNKLIIGNIYNALSSMYLQSEDLKKAIEYANKALVIGKNTFSLEIKAESYKIFSDIYKNNNEFEKAYNFHTKYKQVKDSILNEDSNKQIANMQIKYETEKKENENEILKKEKQNRTILLLIFIIAFLLSSGLFIFATIQKRKKGVAYKVLVERNIEIVESEKNLQESKHELEAIIEHLNEKRTEETTIIEKKYSKSKLSDNKIELLAEKINRIMEEEKIYTQNKLTLKILANKLDTNTKYISRTINEKFNCNFNTFTNQFRIKEARRVMTTTDMNKVTIEAIAIQVGFNSSQSFINAFKKFTGITPSFYLKSIKEQNKI